MNTKQPKQNDGITTNGVKTKCMICNKSLRTIRADGRYDSWKRKFHKKCYKEDFSMWCMLPDDKKYIMHKN